MNNSNIKKHIITPALQAINSYSDDRLDMVFVTGAAETLYKHVRQIKGPALGYWQMEPKTHDDLWRNFLGHFKRRKLVDGLSYLSKVPGDFHQLEVNPWYAAAMCAIHYMRFPEPLPHTGDRMSQAEYHKEYYNTHKGKSTIDGFLEKVTEVGS